MISELKIRRIFGFWRHEILERSITPQLLNNGYHISGFTAQIGGSAGSYKRQGLYEYLTPAAATGALSRFNQRRQFVQVDQDKDAEEQAWLISPARS